MVPTSLLSHTPPLDSSLSLFVPPSLTLLQLVVTNRKCAFSQASEEKDGEREERMRKSKAGVVMTCIWSAGVDPERASSVLMTSPSPPSILPLKQTLSSQSKRIREGGRLRERASSEWMRAAVYPLGSRTQRRQEELRERESVATLCWEAILTIPSFTQTLTHSRNKVSPCCISGWTERMILPHAVWGHNLVWFLLIFLPQFILLRCFHSAGSLWASQSPAADLSVCVYVHTHVCRCAFSSMRFFTSPGRDWNFACLQARRDAQVSVTDVWSTEPAGLAGETSAFFLPTVLWWRHAESAGFCVLWDQYQVSAQVLEWELWVTHTDEYTVCFMKMKCPAFAYIVQDGAWWFLKSAATGPHTHPPFCIDAD